MQRGFLFEDDYKPQFSGHETFPLKYGWLKKVYDVVREANAASPDEDNRWLFSDDQAIARFGVGKNMVSSMKHWAIASGIIHESENNIFQPTPLGDLLFSSRGLDPWLENPASLWLLHWNIAGTPYRTTSYYWLFNHFGGLQFDRQQLIRGLLELCDELKVKNIAATTLERDVQCLVRAYVSKPNKSGEFSEDSVESPLAELGLIQPLGKNDRFQLKRSYKSTLSDSIFVYALIEFWSRYTSARTLSMEAITYEPGSPGRTFLLDEDSVADRLYRIEQISDGLLNWSETAGLRQVISTVDLSKIAHIKLVSAAYKVNAKRKAA